MNNLKDKIFNKANLCLLFCFVLSAIRLYFGNLISVWIASTEVYDDALMINYAGIISKDFSLNVLATNNLLLKEKGFSLFLYLISKVHIKYSIALGILWIVCAIIVYRILTRFTQNRLLLTLSYVFVLFTPVAFEFFCGTRLYRNALITPCVFILFGLMLLVLLNVVNEKYKLLIPSIIGLSIVFPFTYYLKEDGLWLLCTLLFEMLTVGVVLICFFFKRKVTLFKAVALLICISIPFVSFLSTTRVIKNVNYINYGVEETNNRTQGELSKFCNNVYKIKSENRTSSCWAPFDAIEKAFDASPTLSKYPELFNQIKHSPWCGGEITVNPIHGDFLGWVLKDATYDCKCFKNNAEIQKVFKKANNEISEAFDNGTLKKDKKIQLVSSMGGRNKKELSELLKPIAKVYACHVFLYDYQSGAALSSNDIIINEETEKLTGERLFTDKTITTKRNGEIVAVNKIVDGVIVVYRFINAFLFMLSIVSVIITIISFIKNKTIKKEKLILSLLIVFFASLSLVYSISIAWFSSFINVDFAIRFYSIGIVPMISFIEIFGVVLLGNTLFHKKQKTH